jgi:sulfur transfer complex TusBCD TusB component (DsrH family)
MIVTISNPLTITELDFLVTTLSEDDAVIASSNVVAMTLNKSPFKASCFIRENDIYKIGNSAHSDWTSISDAEWVALTVTHDKAVTW